MIVLHIQPRFIRRPEFRQPLFKRQQLLSRRQSRCFAQNDASKDPSAASSEKKRKFITREEEPEQYWTSEGERAGSNPMKDPLAIIGLIAIFAPFVILAIAAATGLVDLTP